MLFLGVKWKFYLHI